MFYRDILPTFNQTMLKIKLSNFSAGMNTKVEQNILPLNVAVSSYNFDFNSGALVEGMGFGDLILDNHTETPTIDFYNGTKTMQVPSAIEEIENVWVFRHSQNGNYMPVILICADNQVYYSLVYTNLNTFSSLSGLSFNYAPDAINIYDDEHKMVFYSKSNQDSLTELDEFYTVTEYNSAPRFFALEQHGDRLFAVVGNEQDELWFSDETNPCNWVAENFDGGFIKLTDIRGQIKALISHTNYLYLIREYGISRLSGFGEPENFVIKNLTYSQSQIFGKTAALCGDDIYMLCQDGIYKFDGLNMYRINLGFESMMEHESNKHAVGAFVAGKYYVACRLNFDDGASVGSEEDENWVNNCLIEYDVSTGQYSILRGVDIRNLTALNVDRMHKLIVCFNGELKNKLAQLNHDGKIFGTPTKKVWKSPKTDIGYPDKIKVIKNFYINTSEDIVVNFYVDGKKHSFNIKGKQTPSRIMTALKGTMFQVEIESNSANCNISNPQIQIVLV